MQYVLLLALLVLIPLAIAGLSFAPWVPTWRQDIERALRLVQLKPGEVLYDLGSGDGKVVFIAAQQFGAKAKGVELVWPLWLWSQVRRLWTKGDTAFILGDLFGANISDADVIYLFGMPKKMTDKLRSKFERELKPGARVVTYSFPISGWTPSIQDKPSPKQIVIYVYQR
jgi:SAM-dependent methyltransferase